MLKKIINDLEKKGLPNWGSKVIPNKFHLTIGEYESNSGDKIVIDRIVMTNGHNEVTFPLKGYIEKEVNGKMKRENNIWTLDGRVDVLKSNSKDIKVELDG